MADWHRAHVAAQEELVPSIRERLGQAEGLLVEASRQPEGERARLLDLAGDLLAGVAADLGDALAASEPTTPPGACCLPEAEP